MADAQCDRGAATVELGIMLGFLMLLALGAFEYGMLFAKSQDVVAAAREGARAAASAGDEPTADCLALEAASGALFGTTGGSVAEIWIEQSNVGPNPPRNVYRPAVAADDPALLECSGGWYPIELGWPSTTRDDEGGTRDSVNVRVVYDHDWVSGFLWFSGSSRFGEETTMRLPPNR